MLNLFFDGFFSPFLDGRRAGIDIFEDCDWILGYTDSFLLVYSHRRGFYVLQAEGADFYFFDRFSDCDQFQAEVAI